MATYKNILITHELLDSEPNSYVIFGDNLIHRGFDGAAKLRDHPHAIGFITKKYPDNKDESFYRPEEYSPVFFEELEKLKKLVKSKPDKKFYITQIGGGLANKFYIWEKLIRHNLVRVLEPYDNVVFCWGDFE